MEAIKRGKGATETERYLATLADATFLDMWSYPNTFINKGNAKGGNGKELCDLLVIFDDNIIIFSDKSINWPNGKDTNTRWARWFRRAVSHSVSQIRGAERWLRDFPDRIFTDELCSQKLPIELPKKERQRIHCIAVALGANEACKGFRQDDQGSLAIASHLVGDAHIDIKAKGYTPFAIGDVDPSGSFIHVFDKAGLDLVVRELDTVSDFVRYLEQRSSAIRQRKIYFAPSEAELLAFYMQSVSSKNLYEIPTPVGADDSDGQTRLTKGMYSELVNSGDYREMKRLDEQSYFWDKLIQLFSGHVLAGTSVAITDQAPSFERAEPALRMMARERRFVRRLLGDAFYQGFEAARRSGKARFARFIQSSPQFADEDAGYLFMYLNYPTDAELREGYGQYRKARVAMLDAYCGAALYDNRQMKRVVGIAVDGLTTVSEVRSEDLMVLQIEKWTPELERDVEKKRKEYDVFSPSRVRRQEVRYTRVPELSRQQRRAAERKSKKEARRSKPLF